MRSVLQWFRSKEKNTPDKPSSAAYRELRLQYKEIQLIYRPAERTVQCRATTLPSDIDSRTLESCSEEKTAALSLQAVEQCTAAAKQALGRLPMTDQCDFLPPGAAYECLLVAVRQDGTTLCYSNTHLSESGFSLNCEPVHPEFWPLFNTLSSFCPCVENEYYQVLSGPEADTSVTQDRRYFEQTLWACEKCGTGNLMEHRHCIKCKAPRGW